MERLETRTLLAGGFSLGGDGPGATTTIPVGASPTDVASGDFDGDGIVDLAVAELSSGSVRILKGTGAGTYSVGQVSSSG
ncbi:MAG: FG-GAP repeat domain-containing protein, partial [Planctomycetaceae bacterium]